MKDRILKIKENKKYAGLFCILFTFNGKKFMVHTYEETETDWLPETYTALSNYVIVKNHAELDTLGIVETHLQLSDLIKEKTIQDKRVWSHYDYDYFFNSLPDNFKTTLFNIRGK